MGERERNVLFNDALNAFYLRLYGREREMFYLTTHSTHFIYGYMGKRERNFYLTTHSTHFIYGYMGETEGNVLFNDTLNTFYFKVIWHQTYG